MTATWTTPRTWATGEIVTAALANEQWRDNVDYLKERPVSAVSDYDGTVASTASTSFTDLSGMSVNITTSGSSKLRITAAGSGNSSGTGVALYVTALVDGTNQGNATYGMAQIQSSGTVGFAINFMTAAAVSDGAHTVKLQFRSSTGASVSVSHASLVVEEVS